MRRMSAAKNVAGRLVFTQPKFDYQFDEIQKEKRSYAEKVKETYRKRVSAECCGKCLYDFLPIIEWIKNYDIKANLIADIICGVTIAIFHVPQSFGYALLAQVDVVNGLYTALFPMMMYVLLGTSRQNSIVPGIVVGICICAFAVVCMMTGAVVTDFKSDEYCPQTIVTTLSFFVGAFQFIFGLFHLGSFSVFLSEQFVSGFTAGVSVHIGSSQLGGLFGMNMGHYSGAGLLIRLYKDFFTNLFGGQLHWPTLALSAICVAIMLFTKILIDPHIEKRIHIPIPIEFLMVILGTVVSRMMNLEDQKFAVITKIPHTFPTPQMPLVATEFASKIAIRALPIAIVSFAVTVSLGRIWARHYRYETRPNQELYALGASNFFGSFFGCFPVGASVPRSSLQFQAGGRTQLVSIINVALIAVVIAWLGPLLEQLPVSVLSSIIFVSLKKIFMQVRDFKNFWNISRIDGHVWLVTFFCTVLIDVQTGLIIGVAFSLLTLIYKIQRPKTFVLGKIPNTDYYVPTKKYAGAKELPEIKIFHFGGAIHFANAEFFREELARKVAPSNQVPPSQIDNTQKTNLNSNNLSTITNFTNYGLDLSGDNVAGHLNGNNNYDNKNDSVFLDVCDYTPLRVKYIILDFARVTFVDGSSTNILKQVINSYQEDGVTIYIANCAPAVLSMLKKGEVIDVFPLANFYPTIHDAVLQALSLKESFSNDDNNSIPASSSSNSGDRAHL